MYFLWNPKGDIFKNSHAALFHIMTVDSWPVPHKNHMASEDF